MVYNGFFLNIAELINKASVSLLECSLQKLLSRRANTIESLLQSATVDELNIVDSWAEKINLLSDELGVKALDYILSVTSKKELLTESINRVDAVLRLYLYDEISFNKLTKIRIDIDHDESKFKAFHLKNKGLNVSFETFARFSRYLEKICGCKEKSIDLDYSIVEKIFFICRVKTHGPISMEIIYNVKDGTLYMFGVSERLIGIAFKVFVVTHFSECYFDIEETFFKINRLENVALVEKEHHVFSKIKITELECDLPERNISIKVDFEGEECILGTIENDLGERYFIGDLNVKNAVIVVRLPANDSLPNRLALVNVKGASECSIHARYTTDRILCAGLLKDVGIA